MKNVVKILSLVFAFGLLSVSCSKENINDDLNNPEISNPIVIDPGFDVNPPVQEPK